MTSERIGAFFQRLSFRATLIRRVLHTINYPRDPKDEPYLDLAIAAHANYLVSRDKDLLALATGHSEFCKQFRQRTHPLRVVNPVIFLKAVEGS
jgi:predicted nucleic acid-binding protein